MLPSWSARSTWMRRASMRRGPSRRLVGRAGRDVVSARPRPHRGRSARSACASVAGDLSRPRPPAALPPGRKRAPSPATAMRRLTMGVGVRRAQRLRRRAAPGEQPRRRAASAIDDRSAPSAARLRTETTRLHRLRRPSDARQSPRRRSTPRPSSMRVESRVTATVRAGPPRDPTRPRSRRAS